MIYLRLPRFRVLGEEFCTPTAHRLAGLLKDRSPVMTEKNSAEEHLHIPIENLWLELDAHAKSQVITLLLQTAFEVVAAQPTTLLTEKANERPENHHSQSPRATY